MMIDDDRMLTFIEWCQINSFSPSTGQRLINAGEGPHFVQLSMRRKGVTVGENRRWQMSRHIKADVGVFSEEAQCDILSITYDFVDKHGVLYMATYQCCDMTGCIKLFTSLDPAVRRISTMSGAKADTSYLKIGSKWEAIKGSRPL